MPSAYESSHDRNLLGSTSVSDTDMFRASVTALGVLAKAEAGLSGVGDLTLLRSNNSPVL